MLVTDRNQMSVIILYHVLSRRKRFLALSWRSQRG